MPGDILRLGPFTGGLNRASDRSSVLDNELVDCLNFELDLDGSLVSRPAITVSRQGTTGARFLIFGSAEFSGTVYLFGTQSGKTFVSSNEGDTWTELNPGSASRECKCLVQYQGKVWMPATPGSANGGINWDPSTGATAVAALPRGVAAVEHKNRMYVCPGPTASTNESRLSFSDPADFTTWPGSNFIDVSGGDGTTLNAVVIYQDNLLLFKDNSTFVLAYDLSPTEAILREINPVIGVEGPFQVTQHENTLYCFHNENVYEVVNYEFGIVNLKLPLEFDNSMPTGTTARYEPKSLSLLGDRLIVRHYNRTYSLNLRTKTWSEWRKTTVYSDIEWHIFGPLIRSVYDENQGTYHYVTSYSFDMSTGGYKIIHITDGHTTTDQEGFLSAAGLILSTGSASTPDHASLDITGDLRLEIEVLLFDSTPAARQTLVAKSIIDSQESYVLTLETNGRLRFAWSTDGTTTLSATSSIAPTIPTNGRIAFAAEIDVNNGAAGRDVKFYTAASIAGPWTQLGTTQTSAGVTSIFSGTALLEAGSINTGTTEKFNGIIKALKVISDPFGTPTQVANPVFSTQVPGTTSFTDAAGRVWTINSPAKIINSFEFSAIATSKDFDMGDPVRFKRLYWWGADLLSGNQIKGSLQPITLDAVPTWNELGSLTWDELQTWDRLLTSVSPTETLIAADGNFVISKSVKFKKAVRFRKVNFSLMTDTDGSSTDGPCKLFSMLAVVRAKQVVTKASN